MARGISTPAVRDEAMARVVMWRLNDGDIAGALALLPEIKGELRERMRLDAGTAALRQGRRGEALRLYWAALEADAGLGDHAANLIASVDGLDALVAWARGRPTPEARARALLAVAAAAAAQAPPGPSLCTACPQSFRGGSPMQVRAALAGWRYTPAARGGKPVAQVAYLSFRGPNRYRRLVDRGVEQRQGEDGTVELRRTHVRGPDTTYAHATFSPAEIRAWVDSVRAGASVPLGDGSRPGLAVVERTGPRGERWREVEWRECGGSGGRRGRVPARVRRASPAARRDDVVDRAAGLGGRVRPARAGTAGGRGGLCRRAPSRQPAPPAARRRVGGAVRALRGGRRRRAGARHAGGDAGERAARACARAGRVCPHPARSGSPPL